MSRDDDRPTGAPGDEGFLDRWSRRKAAIRRGEPVAPEPSEAVREEAAVEAAPVEPDGPPDDELNDAELAERYGVPDPAALGDDADFSVFMKQGVPDRLRNLALRKLWRSSPVLANLDGLLEYGEDFTGTGYVGVLQTAYEVGSGFAKRIEAWEQAEAEKESARAATAEAHEEVVGSTQEQAGERVAATADVHPTDRDEDASGTASARAAPAHGDPLVAPRSEPAAARSDAPASDDHASAPARRRMRFRFADGD